MDTISSFRNVKKSMQIHKSQVILICGWNKSDVISHILHALDWVINRTVDTPYYGKQAGIQCYGFVIVDQFVV